MSLQEAVLVGSQTTVIGLAIVFLVLFILMMVLKLFEKIFYKSEKPTKEKTKTVEKAPDTVVNEPVAFVEQDEDEEELIAVLTAAIAASLGTNTKGLKIKSYKRISNNAPAWNRAGIRDTMDSRF